MSIKISTYSKDDIDDVLDLLSLGFNHSFSKERWLWLHHQNLLAPSSILLAKDENKLIGVYSVIRKRLCFKGKIIIGGRDIDPVVHPDYRGKGVFSILLNEGKQKFQDVDVFYNFANDKSAPGFIKNGWSEITYRKLLVINLPIIRDFYGLIILLISSRLKTENLSISTISSFYDFKFNNDEMSYEGEIYVEKSKSYYEWRYTQNPDKEYMFYVCKNDTRHIGVIVCSVNQTKLTIVDIVCLAGYQKVQLLKLFLINLHKLNIKSRYIVTWDGICYNSRKLMFSLKKGKFFVRGKNEKLHKYTLGFIWEMGPGESEFK